MHRRMALLSSLLLGFTGTVAAIALGGSWATPMDFSAKMDSRQETPRPRGVPIRADGSFSAKLAGTTLTWKLTYSHLSEPQSRRTSTRARSARRAR